MKTALIFIFSIISGLSCNAQHIIEIMMRDGNSQAYLLDEHTAITFTDNNLIFQSSLSSAKVSLNDVVSYHFLDAFAGIGSINGSDEYLRRVKDVLICRVISDNDELHIWDNSGLLVLTFPLTREIENRIPIKHLPHGIYLAKVKDISVKILL